MHPLMVPALAELRLSEERDRAAALRLARAVRRSRRVGTIRQPEAESASRHEREPVPRLLEFACAGHAETAAAELEGR
jgi:hypothetical protein